MNHEIMCIPVGHTQVNWSSLSSSPAAHHDHVPLILGAFRLGLTSAVAPSSGSQRAECRSDRASTKGKRSQALHETRVKWGTFPSTRPSMPNNIARIAPAKARGATALGVRAVVVVVVVVVVAAAVAAAAATAVVVVLEWLLLLLW